MSLKYILITDQACLSPLFFCFDNCLGYFQTIYSLISNFLNIIQFQNRVVFEEKVPPNIFEKSLQFNGGGWWFLTIKSMVSALNLMNSEQKGCFRSTDTFFLHNLENLKLVDFISNSTSNLHILLTLSAQNHLQKLKIFQNHQLQLSMRTEIYL